MVENIFMLFIEERFNIFTTVRQFLSLNWQNMVFNIYSYILLLK